MLMKILLIIVLNTEKKLESDIDLISLRQYQKAFNQ